MRSMEIPTTTKNSELDSSQIALQREFETLCDVQGILEVSPELISEMEHHFYKDATTSWTHCHNAPAFLFMTRQAPTEQDEINDDLTLSVKMQISLWSQTKSVRPGTVLDQERPGYNSNQEYRPHPAAWTEEPFGLNFIGLTPIKLREEPKTEPLTAQEWRARAHMTRSLDPLNQYQAHFRQEALPHDGIWLREHPTLICYFASPSTNLNTCGV